jgi:hypothetical protein
MVGISPSQLKICWYLPAAPGRLETCPIRSAVTGLKLCAMRIAYNKNASPAARAANKLQVFMECLRFAIGRGLG